MNPLQAIVFTLRSYIQSRRLQRQQSDGQSVANTWYLSEDERHADEVGDLIAKDLANVRIDTRRRRLVYKKAKHLSLYDTFERLQRLYPEIDKNVLESELLFWIEQTSEPEGDGLGFTQEQMDEHQKMVENWFDDYHRDATSETPKIAENNKITAHLLQNALSIIASIIFLMLDKSIQPFDLPDRYRNSN